MNVVCERFDARDLRFDTLPVAPGVAFRCRFGAGVSWSEPESPETVEVGVVSGLAMFINGEIISDVSVSGSTPENDFCRAFVRDSVSRAIVSASHVSAKVGRKAQLSILAKFSKDAIFITGFCSKFEKLETDIANGIKEKRFS